MITPEALEAARKVMARGAYQLRNDELPYEHVARSALEAAAPHMSPHSPEDLLLGVYTMTEPELQEMLRAAKAEAWDEGATGGLSWDENLGEDFKTPNPYRSTE